MIRQKGERSCASPDESGGITAPSRSPGFLNRKHWRKFRFYDSEKVLWGSDEELNRDLRRRTLLGHLPRGMVLDLLRGKGDPEEAKRILAMVKLADL
jgi:hypothetical protein